MINVNGQQFGSWQDVPPEIRAKLAHLPDRNGDGIPDVLQGDTSGLGPGATTVTSTSFSVNGVEYASIDDLPAALRAEWDRALQSFGAFGNLVADAMRGGTPAQQPPPGPEGYAPPGTGFAAPGTGYAAPRPTPSAPSRPTLINGQPYEPDAGRKRWWQFWK